ncbi:MAG: PfkB family carbohydrate kinase [Desulfatiglandaceae bacterium]
MKQNLENVKVVGFGQASFDFLGQLSRYPQEDHKCELKDLATGCGGPAATAMVTLSRLGVQTSFIGAVGDDRFGAEIIRFLETEKVDISFLKSIPGCMSQLAFIAVTAAGSRTIFWHRGTVPSPEPSEIDLSPFTGARVLHLDGLKIEASIAAARQAKSMGITVVLDAGTFREGTDLLLPLVDILIASERFAVPLVGVGKASDAEAIKTLVSFGPTQVVITQGARGSVGFDGGEIIHQTAFNVKAVDTTGAGDVYHGAYIYRFLEGEDIAGCMKFASAAAAYKCTVSGNLKGVPHLEQVLEIMNHEL